MANVDSEGMKRRMDAIRLKQILGESLTDRELMCLQIEQNGMVCPTAQSPHQEKESSNG